MSTRSRNQAFPGKFTVFKCALLCPSSLRRAVAHVRARGPVQHPPWLVRQVQVTLCRGPTRQTSLVSFPWRGRGLRIRGSHGEFNTRGHSSPWSSGKGGQPFCDGPVDDHTGSPIHGGRNRCGRRWSVWPGKAGVPLCHRGLGRKLVHTPVRAWTDGGTEVPMLAEEREALVCPESFYFLA